jgi:hypothetical protein
VPPSRSDRHWHGGIHCHGMHRHAGRGCQAVRTSQLFKFSGDGGTGNHDRSESGRYSWTTNPIGTSATRSTGLGLRHSGAETRNSQIFFSKSWWRLSFYMTELLTHIQKRGTLSDDPQETQLVSKIPPPNLREADLSLGMLFNG